MASSTLNALNALAEQVPGLNQRAHSQVQAARDISLQKQIQAAPRRGQAAPQAQALATQRATQAGQDIIARRQAAAGKAGQIRQAALQERQRVGQQALQQRQLAQQERLEQQQTQQLQQLRQEELASRKTVLEQEIASAARLQDLGIEQDNRLQLATIKQREDLSRIGLDVKAKLLDARLLFSSDDRGRKFTNERQLADWTATSAASKQEFNIKMSQMENTYNQKMQIMKNAQAKLQAAVERGFLNEQDDLDFEAKKRLAQLNADAKEKIRREEARAKNRQAMYQTGGALVGATIGTVIAPGAGTVVGAKVGSSVGSLIGGAT